MGFTKKAKHMITVSVRLNDYLARWIVNSYQCNRNNTSEFIRHLLYEKMQCGHLEFNRIKTHQNQYTKSYRSKMWYIIFAAKLLERFVIATQENGEEIRDQAFQETETMLSELNLDNQKNKDRQLCVSLNQQLYSWLNSEAIKLKVRVAPLIRNIIENVFESSLTQTEITTPPLAQKVSMEHQLTTCELLKRLVRENIEDAETMIEKVFTRTNEVLSEICPEKQQFVN